MTAFLLVGSIFGLLFLVLAVDAYAMRRQRARLNAGYPLPGAAYDATTDTRTNYDIISQQSAGARNTISGINGL